MPCFFGVSLLLPLGPIETKRLHLRRLTEGDAEDFHLMTNEPAIIDAIHFLAAPFTVADAQELIGGEQDGDECFWGIWLRETASLIGCIGTHLRKDDGIEIGYWLASAKHGHGFASEAVSSMVSLLAAAYPDRTIFAECRPQNTASWRLLEKIGFDADGQDGLRPERKRLVFERGG
jgi:RimJ/RimL family protein N-acetyltransferase